jgi:NTE family protein
MVHIGVLKVLEEARIPIAAISGTSSGSIIGAGFCSGLSAAELAEVGCRLRFKDVARWTLDRGGFCSNDRLGALLARMCPFKDFSQLRTPLVVVATELISGQPAIFRKGSICEAVRASCAYPGMFTPVEINSVLHVDGMLSYEVPTTPLKLKQMGIDCVMGVHLQSRWNQTNVDGFAFDDFARAPELIAVGEESMRAALPALKHKLGIVDPKQIPAKIPLAKVTKPAVVRTPA